jgi:hypothetical protein
MKIVFRGLRVFSVVPKRKNLYSKSMIVRNRRKRVKTACFLLVLCLAAQSFISQNTDDTQIVPEALRRPERGESPRYPKDLVIGDLGQGEVSEGAYLYARNILTAVTAGRADAQVLTNSGFSFTESMFDKVRGIRPRDSRLGGGRNEPDGCVSFLIRIIGPQESITGELFIRLSDAADGMAAGRWLLDDLILEEKRTLSDIRDSYRYDFSPYERFY